MERKFSNAIERIKYYIEYKRISLRKFSENTGISHSLINKINAIGSDKLEKILSIYSELSAEWLLRGEGPMLKESSEINQETKQIEEIEKTSALLLKRVEELAIENDKFKAKIAEIELKKEPQSLSKYNIASKP